MAKPETVAAHTECWMPTGGERVKYINITTLEEGGVKITMRGRHGGMIDMELSEADWQVFASQVAKVANGQA